MKRGLLRRAIVVVMGSCAVVVLATGAEAQLLFPGSTKSSEIGNAALVKVLLTALRWQDRAEAARQLGDSGDPRVVQALATAAVNDPNARVREAATDAITQLRQGGGGWRPNPPWPLPPPPGPPFNPVDPQAELVQSWYQHFLGRSVDGSGIQTWVALLRQGVPPEDVLGGILGSPEYYRRNGGTPVGFVRGLYRDVLGREPGRDEIPQWVNQLRNLRGDR